MSPVQICAKRQQGINEMDFGAIAQQYNLRNPQSSNRGYLRSSSVDTAQAFAIRMGVRESHKTFEWNRVYEVTLNRHPHVRHHFTTRDPVGVEIAEFFSWLTLRAVMVNKLLRTPSYAPGPGSCHLVLYFESG